MCYCYWAKATPQYDVNDKIYTTYVNGSFEHQYRILNGGVVERFYIHQQTKQRGLDDDSLPYHQQYTVYDNPSEGLITEILNRHEQIRRIKDDMLFGARGQE